MLDVTKPGHNPEPNPDPVRKGIFKSEPDAEYIGNTSNVVRTQFLNTLKAKFERARKTVELSGPCGQHCEDLAEMFSNWEDNPNSVSWQDVYKIDLLITDILTGPELKLELERRLAEAELRQLPSAVTYRNMTQEKDREDPENLERYQRSILASVQDELHWYYTKRFISRQYGRQMATRVVYCLFGAILFVATPLIAWLTNALLVGPPAAGDPVMHNWFAVMPNYGLFAAVSFGVLGACFSMLISLRPRMRDSRLEDLRVNSKWPFLFLRMGVGFSAALIAYFVMSSGIFVMEIFPDFSELGFRDQVVMPTTGTEMVVMVPTSDMAKLTVWSFIAGFSETFVPIILSRTESNAAKEA